jgi:hypothetical protein
VIEQLKNGVNAMRMPVADLVSNWAYMVMAALAWMFRFTIFWEKIIVIIEAFRAGAFAIIEEALGCC